MFCIKREEDEEIGFRETEEEEEEKMHSFGYRANALLTLSVMVLALMCAMASLSDNLNSPSPSAHVQVSLSRNLYSPPDLVIFCFLFLMESLLLLLSVILGLESQLVPEVGARQRRGIFDWIVRLV